MPNELDGVIEKLLDPLSGMSTQPTAELIQKNANEVHMRRLIDNHIYGLLSQQELTSTQVALLAALVRYTER